VLSTEGANYYSLGQRPRCSALKGRIIIAWGNAPGAGVYDLKPLSLRIKMGGEGAALGFNKAPFQG